MKDSLLLLPQFILKLLLCIVFLFLTAFPSTFDASLFQAGVVLGRLSRMAPSLYFAAVLFALFSSLVRLLRKPGIKYVSFPLLFCLTFLFLHLGLVGFDRFSRSVGAEAGVLEAPLAAGVLHRSGDTSAFVEKKDGVLLRNVLVHERKTGFSFHPEAVFKPDDGSIRLLDSGKDLQAVDRSSSAVPSFLTGFFRDLSYISGLLTPRSIPDAAALVHAAIVAFFGVSLWTSLRLTRWPLFNFFLTFGLLRAALATVRFLGMNFLPEAAKVVKNEGLLSQVPLAFLALFGILLFFFCLVMKPLESWRRDLDYD